MASPTLVTDSDSHELTVQPLEQRVGLVLNEPSSKTRLMSPPLERSMSFTHNRRRSRERSREANAYWTHHGVQWT